MKYRSGRFSINSIHDQSGGLGFLFKCRTQKLLNLLGRCTPQFGDFRLFGQLHSFLV